MLYSFSAFCVPAISATVADSAGGVPLSRVLTLVFAGYSAGSIISPAAGGWLAQMANMRTVYLVAAVCYAVSTLVILMIKPQPVRARAWQAPSVHVVRSNGLLALIAFAMFLPLYIGLPLAPNFIRNVAGWPMDRIGLLGFYFQVMDEDQYNALSIDPEEVNKLFHQLRPCRRIQEQFGGSRHFSICRVQYYGAYIFADARSARLAGG